MARLIDADAFMKEIRKWLGNETDFRSLQEVIAGMPTIDSVKQRWISVKDGLPEQYAVVIVYDGECVGEAEFNGVDFGWVESEDLAFATHWMPLPEPPERDDE